MSSRRQYIDQTYLTSYLSGASLSSDFSSVDDLISTAEEMIDEYVGVQPKWFNVSSTSANGVYTPPDPGDRYMKPLKEVRGRVASVGSTTTFTLQQYLQNVFQWDFFAGCWIEIIGGTGVGQTNHVTGSTYAGVITVETAWTTPLDTTSVYRIYQLGKFPRIQDVFYDSINQPPRYYKAIPDAVRRATAAQAAYINALGRAFFESQSGRIQSEHVGSYSYTKDLKSGQDPLIAPEAIKLLRGIKSRKGSIVV